jgi:acid stress-induced BolA-like protein IbaG/YrbA
MIDAADVTIMLRDNFPQAEVVVEGDDGRHFTATIITDAFINKKLLERQKMVYAIIGGHITSGAIHALSLKTFTEQEWQDQCDN